MRRPADSGRGWHHEEVTSDLVSPVFAGREAELAVLAGAFEAAAGGVPATVLLGGEAGGGKTRLVREFTAAVRDRALVLAGGCVELSAAGLPYAPFTAALRELARQRSPGGGGRPAREGARELGRLLPEFGTPGEPVLTPASAPAASGC